MKSTITPPLKWAGGKRWAQSRLSKFFPSKFATFLEPFVGGGATFFALQPKKAILSDANPELITTYLALKDDWLSVWDLLRKYSSLHSPTFFYEMRASRPRTAVRVAARMLYLNRTCWNGLYRVNRHGKFNVPLGSKTSALLPSDDPASVANALQSAELLCLDFEPCIERARQGDLVYVDPPYTANHNQNGFRKYNESIFGWKDQIRLSQSLRAARKRGAFVVISNANHTSIRELYQDFEVNVVYRSSVISSSATTRKRTSELVIVGAP